MKPAGARVKWSGDKARALRPDVLGRAWQQLGRLKHRLSFQNLPQGVENRLYPDGIFIRVLTSFGVDQLIIEAPPIPDPIKKVVEKIMAPVTVRDLLLVYGDPMVHYAFEYEEDSPLFVVGEKALGETVLALKGLWGGPGLVGDFDVGLSGAVEGSKSKAVGELRPPCRKFHYSSTYNDLEILAGPVFEDEKKYHPIAPMDFPPYSDRSCEDTGSIKPRTWAKTIDDVTIMAGIRGPAAMPYQQRFYISATYRGKKITIGGAAEAGGHPYYTNRGISVVVEVLIAFDAWKDGENYYCCIAEEGRGEGSFASYKLNLETLDFELEISARSKILDAYGNNLLNFLRLVGIDGPGRKIYWCHPMISNDPGSYYEETFEANSPVGAVEKKVKDGKAIVDTLWNHVARELLFATEDVLVTEDLAGVVEWQHVRAYMAWGAPYFCTKEYDLDSLNEISYSDPCETLPNHLDGEWVDLVWFGATIPHYEVAYYEANKMGHYRTLMKRYGAGKKYDYGDFTIDANDYGKGEILDGRGVTIAGKDSYFSITGYTLDRECEQDRKDYEIQRWLFTITGSVYEIDWARYVSETVESRRVCPTDPQTFGEIESGDNNVLENAGQWPHNAGWKAILLHGIDREEEDVGPIIVYHDGYVLSEAGGSRPMPGTDDRVFFQSHYETRSIEVGEVTWEYR